MEDAYVMVVWTLYGSCESVRDAVGDARIGRA